MEKVSHPPLMRRVCWLGAWQGGVNLCVKAEKLTGVLSAAGKATSYPFGLPAGQLLLTSAQLRQASTRRS